MAFGECRWYGSQCAKSISCGWLIWVSVVNSDGLKISVENETTVSFRCAEDIGFSCPSALGCLKELIPGGPLRMFCELPLSPVIIGTFKLSGVSDCIDTVLRDSRK